MERSRKYKEPLLPENGERCSLSKPHRCLRTECLVSAVIVGLLAMTVTWGSSAIVKAGYELVQARASLTRVEKENELLRLEMAQLKSPKRIQTIAAEKLGMIKPQAVYIAGKEPGAGKSNKVGTSETVAVRSSLLFGNARAEAHKAR